MGWFSCRHPFSALAVAKRATEEQSDEDFTMVTYHLYCLKCGKPLKLPHAKLVGGVSGFMGRRKCPTPHAGKEGKVTAKVEDLRFHDSRARIHRTA